jgi:hypothetical protein
MLRGSPDEPPRIALPYANAALPWPTRPPPPLGLAQAPERVVECAIDGGVDVLVLAAFVRATVDHQLTATP